MTDRTQDLEQGFSGTRQASAAGRCTAEFRIGFDTQLVITHRQGIEVSYRRPSQGTRG